MRTEKRTWADLERETLGLVLSKEQYGWYVIFLTTAVWRLWDGADKSTVLCFLCGLPATFFVFNSFPKSDSQRFRLYFFALYFEIVQCALYSAALCDAEATLWLSLMSTVTLICNQVTPMQPLGVSLALVAKHIAVWHLIGRGRKEHNLYAVLGAAWMLFHIYAHLEARMLVLKRENESYASLQRKEEHIAALYNSLPNGILVVTEESTVVSFNSVLLDFLQLTNPSESLIFDTVKGLSLLPEYRTSGGNHSLTDDILAYIRSEASGFHSLGVVFLHGRYLEWRASKFQWEQQQACIICCRDISRWIELENIAKRESDSKSALVRSVSHELRTPTNAILNLVQDLGEREELSRGGKQDLSMLNSSAQFLLSVINDLLDFSSLVSGRFSLTVQKFDLKETLKECIDLIEVQCRHKKLELLLRYDTSLPTAIYNDKNRLKQVVLNLLSNALKFTLAGRIEVVAVSITDSRVRVQVIDTGIGIDADKISKIFSLYGKLDGNEKMNPQGCGLGLGISNLLVQSLGGVGIRVKSQRHRGSIFSFEFSTAPGAPADDLSPIQVCSDAIQETWEELEIRCIPDRDRKQEENVDVLIADDVDYNRIVLRRIVENEGIACMEAMNGQEVIKKLKDLNRRGKSVAVVLMDVEMPEMDGVTATREIHRMATDGELNNAPIIIGCSAYTSEEDRQLCLKAGMQHYLEKPVNRDELLRLLLGCVDRRVGVGAEAIGQRSITL